VYLSAYETRGPEVTRYQGVRLTKSGTYKPIITTLAHVTLSKDTVVRVAGTFGCWNCCVT